MVEGALVDAVELARKDLAKQFWDAYSDKFMGKMDLTGMANLIAAYAAKELAGKK
jgi:hypothetical protein